MTTRTLTPVRVQHRLLREEGGYAREQESESAGHRSVMSREVLAALALKNGQTIVDATAGLGGHSEAILKEAKVRLIALDADPKAVAATREHLERFGTRAVVLQSNFTDLKRVLKKAGIAHIDGIVFDLGWNSTQLHSGRGFSFMYDEPLSMSYGPTPLSHFDARTILNTWSEKTLADVLFGYGEERYARRIAHALVERRKGQPFETTLDLAEVVEHAVPPAYRRGRTHPATKTFQALRIAVNDELGAIEKVLPMAWDLLTPGGRIAVITFHSIEDRIVKRTFLSLAKQEGRLLYKKPLTPSKAEILQNPRARSAKLRAVEKL